MIKELEVIKAQCEVLHADMELIKVGFRGFVISIGQGNIPQKRKLSSTKPGTVERKNSRIQSNFSEVLEDYIQVRMPYATAEEVAQEERLQFFSETLKHFTHYSSWRELSSLSYGDPGTPCSIVSSIEFDRDGEVFAVAGVTKKIKVLVVQCQNILY